MTAAPSRPLLESFSARLARLGAPKSFAIAVSGGGDSMALAVLSAQFANITGARVVALTVDHGLRLEAATEAAAVARWCGTLGLAHQILRWDGEKPATGVQARAREARYRLLTDAAQSAGAQALLTAHTADDQAETLFMRLARGAGALGLGAMADASLIAAGAGAPLLLLRPLLGTARESLTEMLQAAGQNYVHDPSNDDQKFERVRVRALLGALDENGLLSPAALTRSAERLRAESARLRSGEDALFNALGGVFYAWGGASLDLMAQDDPAMAALFARLCYAVGGGAQAPDIDTARAALTALRPAAAGTLGGALIKRAGGRWFICREPAALTGRAGVAPMAAVALGQNKILWDRRFILGLKNEMDGASAAPCGAAAAAAFPAQTAALRVPPEAIAGSPGVYRSGALTGAPGFPSLPNGGVQAVSLTPERFEGKVVRFSVQTPKNSGESDGAELS